MNFIAMMMNRAVDATVCPKLPVTAKMKPKKAARAIQTLTINIMREV